MSQEEYQLSVLLELRAQAKEQAEQKHLDETLELQRRQGAAQQARQTLKDAERARQDACDNFDRQLGQSDFNIAAVRAFDDYVRGMQQNERVLADKIIEADRAVELQRQSIKRAHEALIQAVKELEAVVAHHQEWKQEQALLTQRKQSDAMDEIAARLWREQNS